MLFKTINTFSHLLAYLGYLLNIDLLVQSNLFHLSFQSTDAVISDVHKSIVHCLILKISVLTILPKTTW